MSLQPVAGTPGLWTDPDWSPGRAGTFAVVIGVSHYPHLERGGQEADDLGEPWIREARRLGQLTVSATTAWRFFRWLRDDYRFPDAPLAQCWLLLAPTPLELAREPSLVEHVAEPTLAACERALRSWSATLRRLPVAAQHASRALLFFSGHGLQVHHEKQLLLPADYLGGELPHWDDALSTSNLVAGLDAVEIPDRLFLIDACRNDFQAIRAKRPQGRSILTEDETAASYADTRLSAILYATAAAQQAWSPVDPSEGPSLFGQAVLEGLAGRPDIELTATGGGYGVQLGKLHGFAMERVAQILQQHGASVRQPVTLGGPVAHGQVTLTEIPGSALAAVRPGLLTPAVISRRPVEGLNLSLMRSASERGTALADLLARRLTVSRSLPPDVAVPPRAGGLDGAGEALDSGVFGSEVITRLWTHEARALALSSRTKAETTGLRLGRVERDDAAWGFRVTLEGAAEPRGYWLQVGQTSERSHGLLLPSLGEAVRYRVEAEMVVAQGEARFDRLEATLSRGNPGPLGEAARLWERYRTADVESAIGGLDLDALREQVLEKRASPLAATVAALVLLRANRLDLVGDWLANLADGFPLLPDGAVLRAEQLMRQRTDREQAIAAAAESLCRLDERGLPFTSEAMSYAAALAERLGRVQHLLPEALHGRFERVRARLAEALVYFRPGGLFTAYAGFDTATVAWLVRRWERAK
ncbi:hypothetical protein ThidrDRAFT_3742 [Thiorhodococcus drewsii AZ1]|uniref:Peptidase C14 caspase domain-containing protein n=1 Tax=Thiorhodococcus drewsii AZ1 TaxID=765913 RepID=G2E629_9GAMM|nr:caspase family protein [Thiorhodococcus drewsii]EGV28446.1 hypothetical protein ThidrDRAFT_3742 [Thiorhodococcus drewsii AZ1]